MELKEIEELANILREPFFGQGDFHVELAKLIIGKGYSKVKLQSNLKIKDIIDLPLEYVCGDYDEVKKAEMYNRVVSKIRELPVSLQGKGLVELDEKLLLGELKDFVDSTNTNHLSAYLILLPHIAKFICSKFGVTQPQGKGLVDEELFNEIQDCVWHYIDDAKDVKRIMDLVRKFGVAQPSISREEIEDIMYKTFSENVRTVMNPYDKKRIKEYAQAILNHLESRKEI